MKAIIIIYLLVAHIFIGVSVVKTDIISRFQIKLGYEVTRAELTPYYHTMLTFQQRIDKNVPDKSIIFIGDSITQGLAVTAVSPVSVNYGIGQDTTVGVLNRISFYHSIRRSKMVIIAIGVNDLKWRDNDEIMSNYQKIIDLISRDTPVLFSAILPVDEVASGRIGANDRIKALNDGLDDLCKRSQRLHFLDISKLIVDDFGNLLGDYHIGDGVHLNRLGNEIWISELKIYSQGITEKWVLKQTS